MDEYTSWCDEEANEKEDAITSSKRTIGDLEATIADAKATIGSLTSSIDELTSKISSSAGVLSSVTTFLIGHCDSFKQFLTVSCPNG